MEPSATDADTATIAAHSRKPLPDHLPRVDPQIHRHFSPICIYQGIQVCRWSSAVPAIKNICPHGSGFASGHQTQLAEKVINQTQRRVSGGKKVDASDKAVSILSPRLIIFTIGKKCDTDHINTHSRMIAKIQY
jgi:hypothetical protein